MRKRILRSGAWSYCSPFFCNSPSCQDPGVVYACPACFYTTRIWTQALVGHVESGIPLCGVNFCAMGPAPQWVLEMVIRSLAFTL